jgi:hypothetical protein
LWSFKSSICGLNISHHYRSLGNDIGLTVLAGNPQNSEKTKKIAKFVGLSFFSYYMIKNEFQIYIFVRHFSSTHNMRNEIRGFHIDFYFKRDKQLEVYNIEK